MEDCNKKLNQISIPIGLRGQGVDHISFLSSTGSPSSTPNQPGETDTYTVWGDVSETINLGTFTVYNGADGSNGSNGTNGTNGDDSIYAGVMAYKATIVQTSTNDPVATVVFADPNEATFGAWTRVTNGRYRITTMSNLYLSGKVIAYFISNNGTVDRNFTVTRISNLILELRSFTDAGVNTDGLVDGTIIIEVYP